MRRSTGLVFGVLAITFAGCGDRGASRRRHADDDDEPPARAAAASSADARERARQSLLLHLRSREEQGDLQVSMARAAPLLDVAAASASPSSSSGPKVRMGATSVTGRLPPEVIQRIVRQNFGRFRLCYESGLRGDPKLTGTVVVELTIGKDGSVVDASTSGTMPDRAVSACVAKVFRSLSFPAPEAGVVAVRYPIAFTPAD